MLSVSQLSTGYGKKQVLYDVSLEVAPGEIVALIGPNGAGKSTVLKAVHGMLPVWSGDVRFCGKLLNSAKPAQNVRRGITYCPQGSRVFDELTVRENIEIGGIHLPKQVLRNRTEHVLQLFPALKDRLRSNAGKLSGGEQQMVALARALVSQPKLLMLDEPSLGLAPGLVRMVFDQIRELNRNSGLTILLVEQKVREALSACHRVYGLKLGAVVFDERGSDLAQDKERLRNLFL